MKYFLQALYLRFGFGYRTTTNRSQLFRIARQFPTVEMRFGLVEAYERNRSRA